MLHCVHWLVAISVWVLFGSGQVNAYRGFITAFVGNGGITPRVSFKGMARHFGKQAYFLSYRQLDGDIDTTWMEYEPAGN